MVKITTTLVFLFFGILMHGQEKTNSELFVALQKTDSILFEQGFNKCNFEALEKIVHKDLEFLHDKGGIQNREQFFTAVRNNICGSQNGKPVRKLVEGSLQVYPLESNGKLYGAIQTGQHEFYMSVPGEPLHFTSKANFTHTWLLENGTWKLYHVLSYNHQSN